ncbi:MAG TPA: hypothetical protein VGH99_17535 [Pseudonocardia sp.]
MASALPTSADVRKARSQADKFVNNRWDVVRTPVLAWIGLGDLAWQNLRELPEQLRADKLRARADQARDRARGRYHEWADHGEVTVERVRTQPQVARAIETVENTDRRLTKRFENLVDEFHEAGQETLSSVSSQTRSLGEKAARRTQKASREAAEAVTEFAGEVAEGLEEAGAEAARDTRSVSRRAANRTAPAKAKPRSTTTAGSTTARNNNRKTS